MRGRAELQSGAILLLGSAIGLMLLRLWTNSTSPAQTGTVFTGQSFSSAIIEIMLVGVLAIGILLILLGGILWVAQRIRDNRSKNL